MKQELICIVCPKGCHLTAEQTAEGWQITGSACTAVKCRMTILIILTSLLGITQHGISLGSFFKLLFCLLVSGVHVGMVFFRQYTVCFFDCSIICILIYTEDLVIVSLLLCHFCTSIT